EDLQDFGAIALALALLAGGVHVLDEVHLELLHAVALARLAAPAGDVEREGARTEAEGLGARDPGEEPSNLVERLHVRHRIGARRAPDRFLVDQANPAEMIESPELPVLAGGKERHLEVTRDGGVERVVDERRFARARDAGDARQGVQWNAQ